MKKILSLLLIVCMLLSFMCGCKTNEQFILEEKQLIQQTITDYVNTVYAFDFTKALDFVAKDTELYSSIEQMSKTYSIDLLINSMFMQIDVPSDYKQKITTITKEWITKLMADAKIESTNIVVDGNSATANVNVSTPDFAKLSEIIENYENYISEEQVSQLIQKYSLASGEDTKWDMVVEMLPMVFETATPEIEYNSLEAIIGLKKIDGNWFVASDE